MNECCNKKINNTERKLTKILTGTPKYYLSILLKIKGYFDTKKNYNLGSNFRKKYFLDPLVRVSPRL